MLALGAFYGLLRKNKGYRKLVSKVAEIFKGKEILYAIIASLIITAMTTMVTQTFIVLIFVPFLISVALKLGMDKLSAFSITFGSMLIGLLGVLYGGEGLYWFNYYTQVESGTGLIYRLIVLIIGYVLFNFINIMHIRKTKREKINEEEADMYLVEKEDKGVLQLVLVIIMMVITFGIVILGYVNWNELFGTTVFNEFHTWLTGLSINEFPIAKAILGTQTNSFGMWSFLVGSNGSTSTTIGMGTTILIVLSLILLIMNRVSLKESLEDAGEGIKKISKCVGIYLLVYSLMMVGYTTQFMPSIINLIFSGIKSFNPYLISLVAGVSHIFNTDLGLTGFMITGIFTSMYPANIEIIHTIFTTLYGYIGIVAPTSGILLIGLSYLGIEYKSWIKYIWLFAVGMLVILMALFTILTYL